MLEKLKAFEDKQPEIVFHWKDAETEAEGWTVINSLRGGAAGGGTRMRPGLNMQEVLSLAKTMEIKFSVCGPQIGGAKSGINFDPDDPRKEGVLQRWYKAVLPLLQTYYGTGGDLNVDEIREVLPITRELGLLHCQEGVVQGHFQPSPEDKSKIIGNLEKGVSKIVEDPEYTPFPGQKFTVADLITGWGVAVAVDHFYDLWGMEKQGKKVIVQGFGNVGGAAAWYMAKNGYQIVGIIDRNSGVINEAGFSLKDIEDFLNARKKNELTAPGELSFEETNDRIWDLGAEVFLPCARSRIVTQSQVDRMLAGGLECISSGANVPFDDPQIFLGPTGIYTDNAVAAIPDFVANCGMARAFAYFMQKEVDFSDAAIFGDVSETIRKGLQDIREHQEQPVKLWQKGLEIALNKLSGPVPEKV